MYWYIEAYKCTHTLGMGKHFSAVLKVINVVLEAVTDRHTHLRLSSQTDIQAYTLPSLKRILVD